MPVSPTERSLISKIAANESWAHTDNRAARTAAGRNAFLDTFEQQVDPDGKLTPAERAVRVENARRAYFQRLALKSAKSRRRAKEARAEADQLDRDAIEADAAILRGGDAA